MNVFSKKYVSFELCIVSSKKFFFCCQERKLEKLKKGSKLVDALSEKREDCWRSLLRNELNRSSSNGLLIELEERVSNSNSAVQSLYRQIQPIQPITVGETVHILKFEQLEQQRLEDESTQREEESRRQSSAKN